MANQPLKIKISGLAGNLIILWKEAANIGAEVGRSNPLPFPVDLAYDVLNLRRIVYRFEFWRSSDGTTLNELIDDFDIDVAKQELPVIETYYYTVNGTAPTDPASNQLQLRDARLKDLPYTVFEKGTGHLRPVMDYVDRSDAGGGFDKVAGYEFQEGGEYMVTVQDKIVVDTPEGEISGGGGISDVIIANESSNTLDATFYNKLIESGYTTSGTGIFNLQPLSAIPTGTHLRFSTQGGNQRYLKIQFAGSDTVRFWGRDRNWIYLGQYESIELLIKAGVCYVLDDKTGYKDVGQRIWGDVVGPNTYLRNGQDYPLAYAGRLYDWITETFSPLQLRTFADWGMGVTSNGVTVYPYKCFFAYDAGTQTLRVPDSMNLYQRAVPSLGQTPGSYQGDMVGPLDIKLLNGSGGSSTNPLNNTQGFSGMDSNSGQIPAGNLITVNTGSETRGKGELLLPLVRI